MHFDNYLDLFLFGIVAKPSLSGIGVSASELLYEKAFLLNVQMVAFFIGGLIWGALGDKRGRLSVLFGSIVLYSLANVANGLVHTVP